MQFKKLKDLIYERYGGYGSIKEYAKQIGSSPSHVGNVCARGAIVDTETGDIYYKQKEAFVFPESNAFVKTK
jgi:hypothetical protein